jgi:midasin (ATPase involved in ribosome maturation)
MSKKETKKYLLYLVFLLLYIAAIRVIDILLFLKLYNEINDNSDILRILSERVHNNRLAEFFLREELMTEEVVEYFGSKLGVKV